MPVDAELGTDGEIRSTGISFQDYDSMHTLCRRLAPNRRKPAPEWVLNDKNFRRVLCLYMEKRAFRSGWAKYRAGDALTRIRAAEEHIRKTDAPRLEATLRRYAAQFMDLTRRRGQLTTGESKLLARLPRKIEEIDTQLRMTANSAATAARCAYLYYRDGLESPAVAAELGLKPPHVRQICYSLRVSATALGLDNVVRQARTPEAAARERERNLAQRIAHWRSKGKTWEQIRVKFGFDCKTAAPLRDRLIKAGLFKPARVMPKRGWKYDHALIVRLRAEGHGYKKIAKQLGCAMSTVQNVANKMRDGWRPSVAA